VSTLVRAISHLTDEDDRQHSISREDDRQHSISRVEEALDALLRIPPEASLSPAPFGDLVGSVLTEASLAVEASPSSVPARLLRLLRGPSVISLIAAFDRMHDRHMRGVVDRAAEAEDVGFLVASTRLIVASTRLIVASTMDDREDYEKGGASGLAVLTAMMRSLCLLETVARGHRSISASSVLPIVKAATALFHVGSRTEDASTRRSIAERMWGVHTVAIDLAEVALLEGCPCRSCRSLPWWRTSSEQQQRESEQRQPEDEQEQQQEQQENEPPHVALMRSVVPSMLLGFDDTDDATEDDEAMEFLADARPLMLEVVVDRNDVLGSSLSCLSAGLPPGMRFDEHARLQVSFVGESGYGDGVVRDWLSAVMAELCRGGVFCVSDGVVHPNVALPPSESSIRLLWMAGVVTAISVRVGAPTGYHLSEAMIRVLQGRPSSIGAESLEQLDPSVAASCRAVMACSTQAELDDMCLPGFCFGDRELIAVGGAVAVTLENRALLTRLISLQLAEPAFEGIREFRRGFLQALGVSRRKAMETLRSMTPAEMNASLGGALDIPANALLSRVIAHVMPGVARSMVAEAIVAFKALVRAMDVCQRRRLLRFWTGAAGFDAASSIPRLQLVLMPDLDDGRMPYTHTCYSQLTVPISTYKGVEEAFARLATSIESFECAINE
jgi:hypothetical protein